MVDPEIVRQPFEVKEVEVEGRPIHIPFLRVMAAGEELILHPFNTLVRTFDEPDNIDHLEIRQNGELQGIPMDKETIEQMVEYNFPFRWDLRPDSNTVTWLTHLAMRNIDAEIDEVEGSSGA